VVAVSLFQSVAFRDGEIRIARTSQRSARRPGDANIEESSSTPMGTLFLDAVSAGPRAANQPSGYLDAPSKGECGEFRRLNHRQALQIRVLTSRIPIPHP
jgi:hypothetical protein